MGRKILLLLILMLVGRIKGENDSSIVKEYLYEAKTRLLETLLTNYNRNIIPSSTNPTHLKFGAALITTKLNAEDSTLDSNLWLRMVWNDPRLKWNKDDFGSVRVLRVHPSQIWIPDIQLYNPADCKSGGLLSNCAQSNVLIYPMGEVLWVPPCRFLSRCKHTLKQLPGQPQSCTLKFGSWTYDGFTLSFGLYNDQHIMDLSDFDDITDWKVLSALGEVSQKFFPCCDEPYFEFAYNLTVQKKPEKPQTNRRGPVKGAWGSQPLFENF